MKPVKLNMTALVLMQNRKKRGYSKCPNADMETFAIAYLLLAFSLNFLLDTLFNILMKQSDSGGCFLFMRVHYSKYGTNCLVYRAFSEIIISNRTFI